MSASRGSVAVVTCLLLASAGCATRDATSGQTPSAADKAPSLASLAGATWTLVSLGGQPLPTDLRPPTAVFDGVRVSGLGGCNRYAGQIDETAPGTIAVSPLAATKMACPPPAMDVESRYFALLAQVTHYRLAGSRLVLSGPSGELAFERAKP
jgi:putative lipoprotein